MSTTHSIQRFAIQIAIPALTAVILVAGLVDACWAQRSGGFDAEAYFRRLDRNGNWYLETKEMNSKAQRYLQRLGFDPSRRVYLGYVFNKLRERQQRSGGGSTDGTVDDTGVATFGLETERATVPSFGIQSESDDKPEVDYSEETIQMANEVLNRYDKNKNGMIDKDEIEEGRWGRPAPSESDEDEDGSLSRTELLNRYHLREEEKEKRREEREKKREQEKDRSENRGRGEQDDRRGRSSVVETRAVKKSPQQQRKQYADYAAGMISRYDKDKDGRLNKAEWKGIRRKPSGTDKNGDGFVDKNEYAQALMKESQPQSQGGGREVQKRSVASPVNRVSRGGVAVPADMSKLDANEDAQVQMHEFSGDWSESVLEDFYAIDVNRDGVITIREWQQRSK
jgi:Ca2+-binding EF-hand superfamily protein